MTRQGGVRLGRGVTYPLQLGAVEGTENRERMGVVSYPPDHHLNNGAGRRGAY